MVAGVALAVLAFAGFSAFVAPRLGFETDMRKLKGDSPSSRLDDHITEQLGTPLNPAILLVDDLEQARAVRQIISDVQAKHGADEAHEEADAAAASPQPPGESLILGPGHTYASVTDQISAIVLTRKTSRGWLFGFAVSFALMMAFLYATAYLFAKGIGIWGTTIPVGWAFPIVNFVWWIGIGHAGTLISAVLLLLHQNWRTSINRFAEAMTLFAVSCAGLFPLLHLGRPWVFLLAVAVSEHDGPVAQLPQSAGLGRVCGADLFHRFDSVLVRGTDPRSGHAARPGARARLPRIVYGMLAMGWRGRPPTGSAMRSAYLLLAGLATPLVVSVHSIVGMDFAAGIVPGWHTTFFSAVLRRRGDFLGVRHGDDADDSAARDLRLAGFRHHAASRQHGQGDSGDRLDDGLRLRVGSVFRVLQRQRVRTLRDDQSRAGPLCLELLGPDRLQHRDAASSLVRARCGAAFPCCSSSR